MWQRVIAKVVLGALATATLAACATGQATDLRAAGPPGSPAPSSVAGTTTTGPTTSSAQASSTAPSTAPPTTASSVDTGLACAQLTPIVEIRAGHVFPRHAWTTPSVVDALTVATPLVPPTSLVDGVPAAPHFQALLAGLKPIVSSDQQPTPSASAQNANRLSHLGLEITYVLNWVAETCLHVSPQFVPLPPGSPIG